jgi:sugar phosphate isomerase/epimerase
MDIKIGCQTLPYSELPLDRALAGIARAGYKYVCYGTTHEKQPALDPDWPEVQTLELG